ncbi:ABC transporter permease [Glycocaulis albus]|jgi:ABC-2 type transport system permease protein|uniref:ABC transporter permease n=1 Tax=Glycocaulis albus TaxID=1382801 RepID=A0ABQ1XJX6_9PROT|nr:ABC transporter permease [Glycocaulis albus]MBV5259246.1 ABC transporter permease subunit [Synechococcus moorigangaii CMS01]GGG95690.1 ABC transporter permease [Glycocaulis albus]
MTALWAVYRRELAAYFETPLAWVFLTAFSIAAPSFAWHVGGLFESGRADLTPLFDYLPWLLMVLMPALAMRAWAEERETGTLEMLLAAPIPLWAAALAKFLAAWTIAAIALTLTFPLWAAVNYLGDPDNAAIATAYFGGLLLAGGYLAISQALSGTTSNQVVAFVLAMGVCLILTAAGLPLVLDAVASRLPGMFAEALAGLSALSRFDSLRRGVISLADLIYFISLIATGLALAMALIDTRRGGGR